MNNSIQLTVGAILLFVLSFAFFSLSAQCTDPFFSEYLEGSSNNKAFEIYNPSSDTLNLSDYRVELFNNGASSPSVSLVPQGILLPGQVFVVANGAADPALLNASDTTSNTTLFNGNDVLILLDISDTVNIDTLDAIGQVGQNPGSSGWAVGSGFTKENTLVRKVNVQQGNLNWMVGATEWDVYPQNTFSFIGSHNMQSCSGGSVPLIGFSAASVTVNEPVGSVSVTVQISNADIFNVTSVEVTLGASSALNGLDFNYTFPDTLTWPAADSSNRTITIPITDDMLVENQENILLELSNPTNGATIGTGTFNILIDDDDIKNYTISQVTGLDANGEPDSLGVRCRLRGVVYGVDLNGSTPLQFTLIDPTDGIGVFAGQGASGYVVNEGDSIAVIGTISQFNGLTQISIDSVEFVSSGHSLKSPTLVTALNETTESDLIRFDFMRLVDPAQWTGSGSGFNVDITNGTDTVTMRIDNEVDLYSQSAPTGNFDVCGIGGQFDSSSPYDEGYQFLPRYSADIKAYPAAPTVSLPQDTAICGGDSILLDAGSFPSFSYLWSTGETSQTITVGPGNYSVTVTDTFGQTGSDNIQVLTLPEPVAGFTCDSSLAPTYSFTSTSTDAAFFAWDFGDGNSSGSQNPTHTFAPGMWTVVLTVSNICGMDTTSKIVDYFTGRGELYPGGEEDEVVIWPNPTSGLLWVKTDDAAEVNQIEVADLSGKVIFSEVIAGRFGYTLRVDLKELKRGMYVLRIQRKGQWLQRKVWVMR